MRRLLAACLSLLAFAAPAQPTADTPVTLATPTGTLHGSLRLPAVKGKFHVALIVAGSGPTDRDGNAPRFLSDSYRQLADALEAEGFASVRYDKRGVAASAAAGPKEADLRFEHYVEDAAAWIAQLRRDRRFAGIVVIGHSEGSLVAALAAARTPPDALVSIAGFSRRAADGLRAQLEPKLPGPLWQETGRILDSLEKGETVAKPPPELAALFRPSVQPYLVSWFRHSPVEAYAKLDLPVLVIQGTADIQVTVADAEALAAAAKHSQRWIVPDMSHVMKIVGADPASQMQGYTDPALPIVPALAPRIAAFLRESAARRR